MFPDGKTKLRVKTVCLPNLKRSSGSDFEFNVILVKDGYNLSIPGSPRGYDLVIPSSKDQEKWLRGVEKKFEGGFREIWYCLWQIDDEEVLQKFLDLIRPNIIEEIYS